MVAAFQDTTALGHAYGVAVISVMFITTILAGIVMLTCYSINPVLVAAFLIMFGKYNRSQHVAACVQHSIQHTAAGRLRCFQMV